jgi:transcriptional regulator with XRE-family HTH domain
MGYRGRMADTELELKLGTLLRKARIKRGITCRRLAADLGWDHSELSRIERGRVTSLSRYGKIAEALGMELSVNVRSWPRAA